MKIIDQTYYVCRRSSTELGQPSAALPSGPRRRTLGHLRHLRLHLRANLLQLHHPILHLLQVHPQLLLPILRLGRAGLVVSSRGRRGRGHRAADPLSPLSTPSGNPLAMDLEVRTTAFENKMAANGDRSNGTGLRIVMFPWLAFGHMLPFLELSKSLARRGHRISFISTPRNIHRLPKLPPEISHLIDLLPFNLPRVDGLREAAEATCDRPPEQHPCLMKALDGLERPFEEFIKQAHPKPDWIVHDLMQHWIPAIGTEHGVPCIYYVTTSAATQAYFSPPPDWSPPSSLDELAVTPPWIPFPSKIAHRRHEILKQIEHVTLSKRFGMSERERCKIVSEGCRAIAIRSGNGLESKYLSLAARLLKKPVLPVGLLPPSASERNEQANEADVAIMKWLDQRRSRSVVYVALGSEVTMNLGLLHELALGLEAARFPFIWALRRPFGLQGNDVKLLPEGFEDRTAGFGMVVMNWAPQVKILAHCSVGGFLTHCGWSSIIEGLQSGRPLVMLPLNYDQGLNARLMEEAGVGVEVERDDDDGSFTREGVARAVRLVLMDDEGEAFRKKAQMMVEIVANKQCADKHVDDFVQFLLTHRCIRG